MVDYKYSELYKQESIDKQLNIAFDGGNITNDDIHSEQFELTESLCSESQLRFGSCEASMIKFRISNIFTPLKDKWLTVTETLNHNTDTPFQFGKYKVYSDTPTADRRYRDVAAYDKMHDIINEDLAEWYNSLFTTDDTEVTLKEFRDSLMSYLGVEQEDVTLVNDDMVIKKTIQPTQLAGKDAISAICEINGCFGHIGRDGKFRYVFLPKYAQGLYPSNDLYPADNLFPRESIANKIDKSLYIDCQYEDYLSQKITKLQIRQEENDIGTIYPGGASTEDDNTYIVQDNFLVYGKSASELDEIASNLFKIIADTEYRPFKSEVVGNPCFEVGDAIRFNTKYQIVESYVLNRTLKGVQGLRDSFSADGEEYYSEKVNAFESQMMQLKGKTNILERNIEETRSAIADVEKNLQSEIVQTADGFMTTVSSIQSKWDISQYDENNIYFGDEDVEATVVSDELKKYPLYLNSNNGYLYSQAVSPTEPTPKWIKIDELTNIEKSLSSRIEQTISSISIEINNGDKTAGIVITLENEDGTTTTLPEAKIEMTGIVTFNDLEGNSQTVINGDYITTGTIDAEKVNVINVVAESVAAEKITGETISGKKISGGSVIGADISATDVFKMLCHYNALSTGYEPIISTQMVQLASIVQATAIVIGNPNFYTLFNTIPRLISGDNLCNFIYSVGNALLGEIIYLTLAQNTSKGTYIHVQTSSTAYGVTIWESDTKLKKNIEETKETALDKIKQIEFVQFDWKSNDSHVDLGVSANQLEEVIPHAVYDVEQSEESEYDSLKNVDNSIMTTYALKAIQEQQEIIDSQQKEIDELKKSVSFLMQKIGGADNE